MTPEGKIADECLRYLNTHGWYAFSVPTTGIYDEAKRSYRTRGVFAVRGVSDAIAIKDGRVLFIEFKTQTGVQSDHQKKFATAVARHGGEYILVRGIDGLRECMGTIIS